MSQAPVPANAAAAPEHSAGYKTRRFFNWFPLGLTYALLYMGRYNLTVSKTALGDLMSKADFGTIFGVGAWVYAIAFVINGPLTDRMGGKKAMLVGAGGSALANLSMALYLQSVLNSADPKAAPLKLVFSLLYGVNMYFQSFGAVAIVKVNQAWFHVRERGTFSGIFGIMISTGLWLAFDVNTRLLNHLKAGGAAGPDATRWVFLAPAILLGSFFVLELLLLRDRPSQAGFPDFDTGDGSAASGDEAPPAFFDVLKKVLAHPVILTIAFVEFCTGVIRNGVMHWYPILAKEKMAAGLGGGWKYMSDNWGLILMVAGVIGGMCAGMVSDKVFQSRRAPAAGFLYLASLCATLLMVPFLESGWALGALVFVMSICVIGTHGLLSGTATMDFGGRKAAGTAVGIIDGFVYLGTGVQSLALGYITTEVGWRWWPVFLAPFSLVGFVLLRRIWDAKPGQKHAPAKAAPEPAAA